MKYVIALIVAVATTGAGATVIRVPADQPTIQLAIDAAANGDTVLVSPGTYFENINFHGKNIVVASHYALTLDPSFITSTVINGGSPLHADTASCVLIISGETAAAVLDGFTLTGGKGTRWIDEHGAGTYREGGGILTALSAPTIRNNFIVGNEAVDLTDARSAGGGGIRSGDGNPTILNNVIVGNRARYGAGIVLNYTGATIRNNIIAQNSGGEDFGGAGIWVNSNGPASKKIENNTIADNSAPTNDGGGLLVQSTSVITRNNIVWGNTALTNPQISVTAGSSANVLFCDVQGGYPGIGNINTNPAFIDTSYYLSATSPCIDAGNTEIVYNDPPDTVNPLVALLPARGGLRNDMGAFGGPGSRRTVYVDLHLNDPRPPSGLTAYSDHQTPQSVALSWTDPTTRNDGTPLSDFTLRLYRGSTLIAVIDSGVQAFVDTGLTLHQLYRYYMRTIVPNDSSVLDSAQAYAGAHPQSKPPVVLSITDASDGVKFEWKNPSRQMDNTPLNDLAFVLIYRDDILMDSVAQSVTDTAQPRTYIDTVSGYHSYRLRVRDNEHPVNFSAFTDSTLAFGKIGAREVQGFETGKGSFFVTGLWDTTSALAASGTSSITDSPTGNSAPGSVTSILLPPVILGSYPVLRYADIAIVPPASFAIVDISVNRRKTFQTLKYYDWTAHAAWADGTAGPGDWIQEVIDLSAYAGDTATIRFRLLAGSSWTEDGWYIDDVFAGPADSAGSTPYEMNTAWNMISIPLATGSAQRRTLFPSSTSEAFAFNGKYVPTDSLEPGAGYWVKFDSAIVLNISGHTVPKDTITLRKGWNLVGSVSAPVAASAAVTLPPGILVSAFFSFDSAYQTAMSIEPGKAYWVRSSANGKLILNSMNAALIIPMASPVASAKPRDNILTFTDAGGHRKDLFLMKDADESVVNGDIPPLPPEGVFDIRFASDRDVEVVTGEAGEARVRFQSVRFPLTFEWRLSDAEISSECIINGNATPMSTNGRVTIASEDEISGMSIRFHSASLPAQPHTFALDQNYPNPFNPVSRIRYALPASAHVTLSVYNALGEVVAKLVDEVQPPGYKAVVFDARNLPSGMYIYRLSAGSFSEAKKMMLLR